MSAYIVTACEPYVRYEDQFVLAGDYMHAAKQVALCVKSREPQIVSFTFTLQDSDDYTIYLIRVSFVDTQVDPIIHLR